MKEDYLKVIDKRTWTQLKAKGGINIVVYGVPIGADYEEFRKSVSTYLESVHYTRDFATASNYLQMVTSPRAYDAYQTCINSRQDIPLSLFVETEDATSLIVRVTYRPQTDVSEMITLSGDVQGGTVVGAPAGKLFPPKKTNTKWENRVLVNRTPGTQKTVVQVSSSKFSAPQIWASSRADGWIELRYSGTTEAKEEDAPFRHAVQTEHNDNKTIDCKSVVGHTKTGVCISGNRGSSSVQPPYFLKNASVICEGGGCGWVRNKSATITNDGLTLEVYGENWGASCQVIGLADKYKRFGKDAASCGSPGRVPVIYGASAVMEATAACEKIATIHYTTAINNSNGAMQFSGQGDGTIMPRGEVISTPGMHQRSFFLQQPSP
jgi:hypothetical protein